MRVLLSVLGLFFGTRLVFASDEILSIYQTWGFQVELMRVAGVGQIIAALLIWTRRFQTFGLLFFWTIVSVAVLTHLRLDHSWSQFVPAVIVGGLVLGLLRKQPVQFQEQFSKPQQTILALSQGIVPEGFTDVPFEIEFEVSKGAETVTRLLNSTNFFSSGQIFPYRVEFLDPQTGRMTSEFKEGVWTNHHGPLLSAAGVLSKIDGAQYRSLDYTYGSYAISFRLFRPYRLELWFIPTQNAESTRIRVRLSSHIRRGFEWAWRLGQTCFWWSFSVSIRTTFRLM